MNAKRLFIPLLLLAFSLVSYSQDSTFRINFPDGWTQFQRNDVLNSFKNTYELTDKMKQEILANAASKQLYGYAAPLKQGTLYRPNIQVLLLKNPAKDFTQFKMGIEKSLDAFKGMINDLKILDPVSEMTIDGKKSVYTKITGYIATKTGGKAQLIARVYAIPTGNYFYQITMNDSNDYNCEEEFKKVLSSLKL